jgi:threonyl-tRNA synthetase
MHDVLSRNGYQHVKTPLLFNKGLWEISGHWGKYRENMFLVLDSESGEHDFSLKPMNCPVASPDVRGEEAFVSRAADPLRDAGRAASQRGVRRAERADSRAPVPAGRRAHLPARGPDRRRGASASSRCSTTSTRHSVCRTRPKFATRPEQRIGETRCGTVRRPRCGCAGSDRSRLRAEGGRRRVLRAEDRLRREPTPSAERGSSAPSSSTTPRPSASTCGTVGEDNHEHRPVVIHRAIFGSFERFIAILIEHFAGDFPLWLAPEQVRVLPINDELADDAASSSRSCAPPACAPRWMIGRRR